MNTAEEEEKKTSSKFKTDCLQFQKNSYKCLEENAGKPSACQSHFDVYKACRKDEHTRMLEERLLISSSVSFKFQVYNQAHRRCSSKTHSRISLNSKTSTTDISAESNQINKILTKAVQLASIFVKQNKNSSNTNSTNHNIHRKSVLLSFRGQHTISFTLPNATAARKYLSLPASSYSVLDSTLVTRVSDETFRLSIPLQVITMNMPLRIDADLATDITVSPRPQLGSVTMRSEGSYLVAKPPVKANTNTVMGNTSYKDSDGNSSISGDVNADVDAREDAGDGGEAVVDEFADYRRLARYRYGPGSGSVGPNPLSSIPLDESGLPLWLFWGGSDISDAIGPDPDTDSYSGPASDDDSSDSDSTSGVRKRFAVQPKVSIELSWDPVESRVEGMGAAAASRPGMSLSRLRAALARPFRRKSAKTIAESAPRLGDNDGAVAASAAVDEGGLEGAVDVASGDNGDSESVELTALSSVSASDGEEGDLQVDGRVSVDVEMCLSLPAELASALSFPPVRVLLQTAAGLTTSSVLKVIGPGLVTALEKDFSSRYK